MEIEELLKKVPKKIFDRGKKLLEEKRILEIEEDKSGIKARIQGSYYSEYTVRIKMKGKEVIDWSCTCPYDGDICKHVVAVLLEVARLRNVKVRRKKRKTKDELAEEMVDKLSPEELKEFVKNFLQFDKDLRDALLAQFSYYADIGTKSLEAKYNTIFRNLLSRYKRDGFIDYHAAIDFGNQVERLISSGEKLLRKRNLDEAFVIAKTVIRNWTKNIENMDDSAGSTSFVMGAAFGLLADLYRAGKEEVFDFLIEEGKEKVYGDYGIDYDFADTLVEIADSLERAKKVLEFLSLLHFNDQRKAKLLLKFFPEEYEKFVEEYAHDWQVAEFHIEELMKRKDYERALNYIDLVLSLSPAYYTSSLSYKATILKKLDRRKEALQVYLKLFSLTHSISYLLKAKELASAEEWKEIKEESEKSLYGFSLLEFLVEEKDYEKAIVEMEKLKKTIGQDLELFREGISIVRKLPERLRSKGVEILLDSSIYLFESRTNREFYKSFLSTLDAISKIADEERIRTFLKELIERYPRRRALKEEVRNYLHKLNKSNK